MTKRELVAALEQYPDDWEVYVAEWPVTGVTNSFLDTNYDGNFKHAIDLIIEQPKE